LHSLAPDEKVRIALRPRTSRSASITAQYLSARVLDRRYQDADLPTVSNWFGKRLEVIELGTAARHQVGIETTGVAAARKLLGPIATPGRCRTIATETEPTPRGNRSARHHQVHPGTIGPASFICFSFRTC